MNSGDKPGCLTAILQALGLRSKSTEQKALPYRIRDDFLSPAEFNFHQVLQTAVSNWAVICPKVSLGDLFYAKTGDYGQKRGWMNRIDRKHVDFLLCNPKTMRPLLGIELDDASHRRTDRQERDHFANQVFEAAGLPLQRVSAQTSYNVRELSASLRQRAGANDHKATLQTEPGAARQSEVIDPASSVVNAADKPGGAMSQPSLFSEAPLPCPKCGQPMVLRMVKKEGPHKGKKFWGCRDFPRCRGTREYMPEGED